MMNKQMIAAIGYLDDDLMERAAEDMMTVEKGKILRPGILAKGIAIAACLCLIVGGGCYVGIRYFGTEPEVSYIPRHTIAMHYYNFDDTSFAKLKIDEIADENLFWGGQLGTRVLLLKCTVVEDYYEKLEKGTQVVLTLKIPTKGSQIIDKQKYYHYSYSEGGNTWWTEITDDDWMGEGVYLDAQVVIDFLRRFDSVYAYFGYHEKTEKYYYAETDQTMWVRSPSNLVQLDNYEIFPITDEKIDLKSLNAFFNEWNIRPYFASYDRNPETQEYDILQFPKFFEGYIQDGMDEDTFVEVIRKLKEEEFPTADFCSKEEG